MRGILFKPAMVQAIIAGTKTQTRRVMKTQPVQVDEYDGTALLYDSDDENAKEHLIGDKPFKPNYQHGDILYVRESFFAYGKWTKRFNDEEQKEEWHFVDLTLENGLFYQYEESPPVDLRKRRTVDVIGWYKRPSLFMPTVASRLFLEVTEVRAEQLQDISPDDAQAEGIEFNYPYWRDYNDLTSEGFLDTTTVRWMDERTDYHAEQASYRTLWELINGRGSWAANPFVWAYTFKVIDKPAQA